MCSFPNYNLSIFSLPLSNIILLFQPNHCTYPAPHFFFEASYFHICILTIRDCCILAQAGRINSRFGKTACNNGKACWGSGVGTSLPAREQQTEAGDEIERHFAVSTSSHLFVCCADRRLHHRPIRRGKCMCGAIRCAHLPNHRGSKGEF